jgi:hypothetical protein
LVEPQKTKPIFPYRPLLRRPPFPPLGWFYDQCH